MRVLIGFLAEFLSDLILGQVFKPSKVEIFEEDEILVLEFSKILPIGEGVLAIEFEGVLNDKMKGFYRR